MYYVTNDIQKVIEEYQEEIKNLKEESRDYEIDTSDEIKEAKYLAIEEIKDLLQNGELSPYEIIDAIHVIKPMEIYNPIHKWAFRLIGGL